MLKSTWTSFEKKDTIGRMATRGLCRWRPLMLHVHALELYAFDAARACTCCCHQSRRVGCRRASHLAASTRRAHLHCTRPTHVGPLQQWGRASLALVRDGAGLGHPSLSCATLYVTRLNALHHAATIARGMIANESSCAHRGTTAAGSLLRRSRRYQCSVRGA